MMRIVLFLATNLAVLLIASVTLKLLGVDRFTGQNYGSLLAFCAVFGFVGSFTGAWYFGAPQPVLIFLAALFALLTVFIVTRPN